jgi:hypothetical protein
MKLLSKWKKRGPEMFPFSNKHVLFDDIVGFDDVKYLFKLAINAERPVHLLLCGPLPPPNLCLCVR